MHSTRGLGWDVKDADQSRDLFLTPSYPLLLHKKRQSVTRRADDVYLRQLQRRLGPRRGLPTCHERRGKTTGDSAVQGWTADSAVKESGGDDDAASGSDGFGGWGEGKGGGEEVGLVEGEGGDSSGEGEG